MVRHTLSLGLVVSLLALVAVPLAPARARERGHDQAAHLASACAAVVGLPLRRALRRVRDTPSQVGLGREARRANVRAAFAAEPIAGGVALVDDVVTTGSTLSECARTLRRAGATEIRGVVVAVER
jgi:predicted amidophosphoribosyltransferase